MKEKALALDIKRRSKDIILNNENLDLYKNTFESFIEYFNTKSRIISDFSKFKDYLLNKDSINIVDRYTFNCNWITNHVNVSSSGSVTIFGFRSGETVIRYAEGLDKVEVIEPNLIKSENSNNILYSTMDKYNTDWWFAQVISYYYLEGIILMFLLIILGIIYNKKNILIKNNNFFSWYCKYISFSIIPISSEGQDKNNIIESNESKFVSPVPKAIKKADGTWDCSGIVDWELDRIQELRKSSLYFKNYSLDFVNYLKGVYNDLLQNHGFDTIMANNKSILWDNCKIWGINPYDIEVKSTETKSRFIVYHKDFQIDYLYNDIVVKPPRTYTHVADYINPHEVAWAHDCECISNLRKDGVLIKYKDISSGVLRDTNSSINNVNTNSIVHDDSTSNLNINLEEYQSVSISDDSINSLSLCNNAFSLPFGLIIESSFIPELISIIPVIFLGIIFIIYSIKGFWGDQRSSYIKSLFFFTSGIKGKDFSINIVNDLNSFLNNIEYYYMQEIFWFIFILLLGILLICLFRKFHFYFKIKGKEYISVIPVTTSNVNNIGRSSDLDKVLEETNNVNNIVNAVLNRKGYLDSKDIDGVRRILNWKLQNKGLSDRYLANITVWREEDPFDVDKYIVENLVNELNSRQGTYTARELKILAQSLEKVLVESGLYPRFNINFKAYEVIRGVNSTSINQNGDQNICPDPGPNICPDPGPNICPDPGPKNQDNSSDTAQSINTTEKNRSSLDLSEDIINLPFDIMIEAYYIPELLSMIPLILFCLIYIWTKLIKLW